MWAAAAMPQSENVNYGLRRRAASRDALSRPSLLIPLSRGSTHGSPISSHPHTPDIDCLLEPAIEGPPSPERLRQLSKQMKRASHLNRSRGHRSGSGSSPRLAVDVRPQWEQALENLTLTRRSSNRSTGSSTPSRDQPERDSVAVLGRMFHRSNKKSKRASSQYSSSNSSLYSSDAPGGSRDSIIPSLFTRRKPSRDDAAQKKLQISGPFNFQHVTHTQKDSLPNNLQRATHIELDSAVHSPGPATAPGALNGIQAQDLYFSNISNEFIGHEPPLICPPSRPGLASRNTAPAIGLRRVIRTVRSSEHLRGSPTRPSRPHAALRSQSPTTYGIGEQTMCGPVPPPRVSSRQSSLLPVDGFAAFATASLDRPRTSGGFRQPQPFSPDDAFVHPPPPATSHGFMPPANFEAFGVDDRRSSHALTTPDDLAWPLASPVVSLSSGFETPLADVPEEEEQHGSSLRPRLSITSCNSLRGSLSVPLLRAFTPAGRSMSGASETLGLFDAERAVEDDDEAPVDGDVLNQGDWEDCIDYCYEHEADANFNYQWERPSMDVPRQPSPSPGHTRLADDGLAETDAATTALSGLSPASQDSTTPDQEVPTPGLSMTTNNFSLPREVKGSRMSHLKSIRPVSYASSFKESQGFSLSPSLLIPGDYHQQMLESERFDYPGHDEIFRETYQGPFHDDMLPRLHKKSPLSYEQRSSTSTTESFSVSDTTTGDRHTSANSSFTALTRLTMSSSGTSLNKAAEYFDSMPVTHFIDTQDDVCDDQDHTPPGNLDILPELTPFPVVNLAKKSYHKSHASEILVRDDIAPPSFRRPRARTSSLNRQMAPPVGQYALFPRTYKATGDRI